MGPITARNLIEQEDWNGLEAGGKMRARREAKKAGRKSKRSGKKEARAATQERLRRKTVRYEPRTFGAYGTEGSMSGFYAKKLTDDIARDASFGLDPEVAGGRGQDYPDPDLPPEIIVPERVIVEAAPEPAQTFLQKNWPILLIGTVVVIGGVAIATRK